MQVTAGVELVAEAGAALGRIVGNINEISGLVSTIAASAAQQSTGLQQINTAVSEMDGVTQQNAAMVEQATAAARSLAHEVNDMMRQIGHFRLRTTATGAPVSYLDPPQERLVSGSNRRGMDAKLNTAGNTALAVQDEDWSSF